MTSILFFIVGITLGFCIKRNTQKQGFFVGSKGEELKEMREEAKEALTGRTEERKNKILELMDNEAVHQEELKSCNLVDRIPGITCNEVEKLLDVSDTTARKYLNKLEAENKIKQVGKSGKGVYYIKN